MNGLPFACHSERSEESMLPPACHAWILPFVQNDNSVLVSRSPAWRDDGIIQLDRDECEASAATARGAPSRDDSANRTKTPSPEDSTLV
jgi:hypothetical protein